MTFQRAVIAGQVISLLLLAAVCISIVRSSFAPRPAEQLLVESLIALESPQYQVNQWFPAQADPQGHGILVRVQYRYYTAGGKPIDTQRVFRVEGRQVTRVESE